MLLIPFYVIANLHHKSRIYIGKSTK